MQPGKPKTGEDTVIFLDKKTGETTIDFRFENYDVDGQVGIYLVRNNSTRVIVPLKGIYLSMPTVNGQEYVFFTSQNPFYIQPSGTSISAEYKVFYTFTRTEHYDRFKKTYPVFKFRLEMLDNPKVFAESNEFKVVY